MHSTLFHLFLFGHFKSSIDSRDVFYELNFCHLSARRYLIKILTNLQVVNWRVISHSPKFRYDTSAPVSSQGHYVLWKVAAPFFGSSTQFKASHFSVTTTELFRTITSIVGANVKLWCQFALLHLFLFNLVSTSKLPVFTHFSNKQ